MPVSALPCSDEELEPVEYKTDLPESKEPVLWGSHKTLGVGSIDANHGSWKRAK